MSILEILQLEKENTSIILHKEGVFWKAYERSAYLFVHHIKAYSVQRKYYKNVGQDIVYIGFPQDYFFNFKTVFVEKKLTVTESEKEINISGFDDFSQAVFEQWKESLQQNISTHTMLDASIKDKIRGFPVINKSPLECQQFLIEIQNEING